MINIKQRYRVLVLLVPLFLLLLILSMKYSYQLTDFTLGAVGGEHRPVSMPISEASPSAKGIYEVRGLLSIGSLTPRNFIIIPDDELLELWVNDTVVDLTQYSNAALRDYIRGVSIDLKDYLEVGDNAIHVRYRDFGGRMGLNIVANPKNTFFIALSLSWTLLVLITAYLIIKACGVGRHLAILLVIAVFVRIMYFVVTDFNVRGHDTYEHLDYINYFIENRALPPVEMSARRVFFHPPLYYVTTAIYSSAVEFVTGQPRLVNRAIQALSLIYSIIFLIFAVKTILLFFARAGSHGLSSSDLAQTSLKDCHRSYSVRYAWMSCLLVAFWPSAILHSPRVGNDSLLYALSAAALYYLVRFYFCPRLKYAVCFAVFVSLGIITKVSAAIFLPVAFFVIIKMMLHGQISVKHVITKLAPIPTALFLASLSFALYPGVVTKLQSDKDSFYIENIDNLHSGLRVPNEPRNYFWFDIKTFMTEAYTSPWEDGKGRIYFWNYLSKTSLFGEWQFPGHITTSLASGISLCFLVIMIYTIIFALNMRWSDSSLLFPIVLFWVAMYAAVTYMRITFPVNIDFRYIVPTLTCSAIFLNYGLYRLQISGFNRAAFLGIVAQQLLAASSVLLVVSLFFQGIQSV